MYGFAVAGSASAQGMYGHLSIGNTEEINGILNADAGNTDINPLSRIAVRTIAAGSSRASIFIGTGARITLV
jgi:hypothetical protein